MPHKGCLHLTTILQVIMEDAATYGKQQYLLFVDFTKAYDSIPFWVLNKVYNATVSPKPSAALSKQFTGPTDCFSYSQRAPMKPSHSVPQMVSNKAARYRASSLYCSWICCTEQSMQPMQDTFSGKAWICG